MTKTFRREALSAWLNSVRIPAAAPTGLFILHVAARRTGLYDRFSGLDGPMHFFGGLAMGWFVHCALRRAAEIDLLPACNPMTHRLLVFSLTCTIAVFWEFVEFFLDWRSGSDLQRGVLDTMADLFLGMAGALLVTLLPGQRSDSRATASSASGQFD